MKITIDTKEDSHEEIRKAILLLQQLLGESIKTNAPSVFENPPLETNSLMGMFNTTAPPQEEKKEEEPVSRPRIELF